MKVKIWYWNICKSCAISPPFCVLFCLNLIVIFRFYWPPPPRLFSYIKGRIRFCHFQEKTKILELLLQLKEGTRSRLKILRCSLVVKETMWFFSLRRIPSFNLKCNFNYFVFLKEWQSLIRHLVILHTLPVIMFHNLFTHLLAYFNLYGILYEWHLMKSNICFVNQLS